MIRAVRELPEEKELRHAGGTFPDRAGANASGNVIGVPGEHLFSAERDRAVERFFRPRGATFK